VRIVRSTLRKLVRRPASWVTAGLVAGLLVLEFLALGATVRSTAGRPVEQATITAFLQFPGTYVTVASQLIGLGGLFALAYAAAVAGSEWGWGTLKSAVARGESRWRYMLLTLLGLVLAAGVAMVAAYAIGVVAAVFGASIAGIPLTGLGDSDALLNIPPTLLHVWLAIAEEMAVGIAVATLTRRPLAGVGAGIALFFGEQFATLILPDVVKFLPFNAASAVVARANLAGAGAPAALPPDQATLVTIAWLVAALLLVAGATERAEIGS
jgi:ABC-2 type transport system permease protein